MLEHRIDRLRENREKFEREHCIAVANDFSVFLSKLQKLDNTVEAGTGMYARELLAIAKNHVLSMGTPVGLEEFRRLCVKHLAFSE